MIRPLEGEKRAFVSVLITARNAETTIHAQIREILSQGPMDGFEVVVNVHPSSDGTRVVVASLVDSDRRVKLIDEAPPGISAGRNHCLKHAVGSYLLSCDADDLVQAGWVDAMLAGLRGADIVAGRFVGQGGSSIDPGGTPHRYLGYGLAANLGFSRKVYESIGGFTSELTAAEDVDFCWRAQQAGFVLGQSEAEVVKSSRSTARARFRQHFRYGQADVQLFLRHRDHGMRRQLPLGLKKCAWVVVTIPALVRREHRFVWAGVVGHQVGRLSESLRRRVLYL